MPALVHSEERLIRGRLSHHHHLGQSPPDCHVHDIAFILTGGEECSREVNCGDVALLAGVDDRGHDEIVKADGGRRGLVFVVQTALEQF